MSHPVAPAYGSDPQSGLICGYTFTPTRGGRLIEAHEAAHWLKQADQDHSFVWLHFNLANAATEKWLRAHVDLPDEFYESLRESSRSTRIENADGCLIAIVNDVLYDFSQEMSEVSTLWLTVDERRMISVRLQPLRSIDRLRQSVRAGEAFRSPLALVVHLLRDQADVLAMIVRDTTRQVDSIEDRFLDGKLDPKRGRLGSLRRILVRLQRLLAPEPGALFRLLNRPPAWIAEEDANDLRQSTEEFSVVLGDVAGLQERIRLLQEELAAHVGEQTNRSVFMLTAVTVLALPINMIAGLFGMNVGGIPFANASDGFWIVVLLVLTLTTIAGWIVFRSRDD